MATHLIPAGTMNPVLPEHIDADGVITRGFHFDLIDTVRNIRTEKLRAKVLDTLSFSIDARINGALGRILNDYYRFSKENPDAEKFVDYQSFLDHIAGLEYNEQSIYEMGLDVKPSVSHVRNLLAFRAEVHSAIASQLRDPTTYITPNLADRLANPTPRKVSLKAIDGYRELAAEDADGDKELEDELFEQYQLTAKANKRTQFEFDRMKAQSIVCLLSCIKADVYNAEDVNDEDDAFYTMQPEAQAGLLRAARNCIERARHDSVEDNRMSVPEKATLRVEGKPLIKLLDQQLEHPIFDTLN
jgi:hypothetical protein